MRIVSINRLPIFFSIFFCGAAFFSSCRKTVAISHISGMSGMKIWHGTYSYYNAVQQALDTTYNIIDTFAITVLNNKEIVAKGDTLSYYLSTDSMIEFQVHGVNDATYISYYFNANVITYQYQYQIGLGGGSTSIILETP